MKTYTIFPFDQQPDWDQVPVLDMEQAYLQSPGDIHAHAQIAYSPEGLFVHLWAEETRIRAAETEKLGMPYEDSCLEFFFSPVAGDPRYFNFEFNPNLCMFLGFGQSVQKLVRLLPEDADDLFQPTVRRFDGGWELFFRIPCDFIRRFFPGFSPKTGDTIRANCYKCADLSEPPHYFSWSPVPEENFSFHRPDSFGTMIFG